VFRHPESFLLLLLFVPVCGVLARNYRRGREDLSRLGGVWRESALLNVFIVKWFFLSFLFLCALLFIIVALASPEWGTRPVPYNPRGIDIVLALDVSRSMKAQDSSPSRLARSRMVLQGLVEGLPENRYALVLIKGDGILAIPPTEDKAALYTVIGRLEPEMYTAKGTNLEAGLMAALNAFAEGSETRKVVILFSDGDSLSGDPREAAREAAKRGILIYTVGAGTEAGSEIPLTGGGSLAGPSGDTVISALNRPLLEELASITGGRYVPLNDPLALSRLLDMVTEDYRSKVGKGFLLESRERYRMFVVAAILCLFGMAIVKVFAWRRIL
jgi:Ca-activated chloride channel family protein